MTEEPRATWHFTPTAECPTLHDAIELVHPANSELSSWAPDHESNLVIMRGPDWQINVIRQRVAQLGIGEVI
ncbi:MAG: hypothetical protein PHX93_00625 [Candidatus Peribacteraceae bacterium]|jgi:hypothetical protein|nr:hypothetical protein [Candidatus Peribacteraceae bacterium]